MGATPLYLAIILAQANAYLRASATLHLSGTVVEYDKLSWILRISLQGINERYLNLRNS